MMKWILVVIFLSSSGSDRMTVETGSAEECVRAAETMAKMQMFKESIKIDVACEIEGTDQ